MDDCSAASWPALVESRWQRENRKRKRRRRRLQFESFQRIDQGLGRSGRRKCTRLQVPIASGDRQPRDEAVIASGQVAACGWAHVAADETEEAAVVVACRGNIRQPQAEQEIRHRQFVCLPAGRRLAKMARPSNVIGAIGKTAGEDGVPLAPALVSGSRGGSRFVSRVQATKFGLRSFALLASAAVILMLSFVQNQSSCSAVVSGNGVEFSPAQPNPNPNPPSESQQETETNLKRVINSNINRNFDGFDDGEKSGASHKSGGGHELAGAKLVEATISKDKRAAQSGVPTFGARDAIGSREAPGSRKKLAETGTSSGSGSGNNMNQYNANEAANVADTHNDSDEDDDDNQSANQSKFPSQQPPRPPEAAVAVVAAAAAGQAAPSSQWPDALTLAADGSQRSAPITSELSPAAGQLQLRLQSPETRKCNLTGALGSGDAAESESANDNADAAACGPVGAPRGGTGGGSESEVGRRPRRSPSAEPERRKSRREQMKLVKLEESALVGADGGGDKIPFQRQETAAVMVESGDKNGGARARNNWRLVAQTSTPSSTTPTSATGDSAREFGPTETGAKFRHKRRQRKLRPPTAIGELQADDETDDDHSVGSRVSSDDLWLPAGQRGNRHRPQGQYDGRSLPEPVASQSDDGGEPTAVAPADDDGDSDGDGEPQMAAAAAAAEEYDRDASSASQRRRRHLAANKLSPPPLEADNLFLADSSARSPTEYWLAASDELATKNVDSGGGAHEEDGDPNESEWLDYSQDLDLDERLALAEDRRQRRLRKLRHRRAKTPPVETIYFGGFFPWLTDESEQIGSRPTSGGQVVGAGSGTSGESAGGATIGATRRSKSKHRKAEEEQQQQQRQKYQQHQKQRQQQEEASGRNGRRLQQESHSQSLVLANDYNQSVASSFLPSMLPASGRDGRSQELESTPQSSSALTAAQQLASAHSMSHQQMITPVVNGNTNSNYNYNYAATSGSAPSAEARHQLGKSILPAVRLALDHINTNSSVLNGYRLEVVPRDTQCNATISLKQFFDMVYEEPKKMLLYGDACRVSTDPIAKASYFFDLIQISYADTDPIYTIENYPNFFRVVPSENALSLARIPFIRHFNWTRVGTIYQNLPRYSLPHSKLLTDLERYKIVIKQSVSLPGSVDGLQNRDLGDELRKLKEKDVRIILGNFDEQWALLLFCEAFRERMIGRKYQWLLTGFSEYKLWQHYEAYGSSCTKQELLVAMDGYIITDITPVTRSQQRTVSGMMAHEYSDAYKRRAREMNVATEENKFYGYVYDGIWAIALALKRVDNQLKLYNRLARAGKVKLREELEGIGSLLDFDYHKPIWVKLIQDALNRTRFSGVTGTAFRDMTEVIIGSYDALEDQLDLKVGFPIFWRGHSPPIDYTIQRVTPFRINRILFVIISILALFGIVLAFVFLFINIRFRNQRYIKMSSPYLNNLIIIGCILTYTSVIILGLDSGLTSEYNFPYICNARAWVLMAGFTLAFGSMFSKTFRVHSIFTNIKLHKKVIKDYKLFMVVFILLTFDICILVVWQYFDPFYRETNNGTSIQDLDNEDIIIVPEMEHCQSKRMTVFLSVIYVYKGLLMAFGCFLAWETRHVSIPALNDSKYIGLSVYNVVIMCVIGASLSFVLRDQQDASFVIISIFIIFCSTTTLCLVFVPKVRMLIELKQNPRAGDHRVRATLKTFKKNYHDDGTVGPTACRDIHGNIIGSKNYGMDLNERIKVLLSENVKQRSTLKEKTYELEALTSKYRKIQNMVQSGQYLKAVNTTASTTGTTLAPLQNSPMGNLTATVSLTSRPPTRDRVSFSMLKDNTANTVQQPVGTLPPIPSKPSAATNCDDQTTSGKLVNARNSPLMSSATQITTTNTTTSSGTNNLTEMTNDYSSSARLISTGTATTSTADCTTNTTGATAASKQSPEVLVNCLAPGSSHPAPRSNGSRDKRQMMPQAPGQAKMVQGDRRSSNATNSPKCTTDSSYCSMANETTVAMTSGGRAEETRVSCPDIAAANAAASSGAATAAAAGHFSPASTSKDPRSKFKKQLSQQTASPNKQQAGVSSPGGSTSSNGGRLPRAISMLEYLGSQDEICSTSESHKTKRRGEHHHQHHQQIRCNSRQCCYESMAACSCNGIESHEQHRHKCEDGDKAVYSSGDMIHTSSMQSCSTCCSLASHSGTYGDLTHSSCSALSHSMGWSGAEGSFHHSEHDCSSHASHSESTERSSSFVTGRPQPQQPIQTQQVAHQHHQAHRHPECEQRPQTSKQSAPDAIECDIIENL